MKKITSIETKYNRTEMQPPPEKKRKTANAEQFWDEDFTEDQWGTIDNIIEASQQQKELSGHKPLPGTSSKMVGKGTMKSRSTNDMNSVKYGTAMLTSGQLSARACGDGKRYIHQNQNKLLSESKCMSSANPSKLAQVENSGKSNVLMLQKECQMLREKAEKIQNEQYAKDGQIKILQAKVSEKEGELQKVKMEKSALIDQHVKEENEKEKDLGHQITKLQTQLQFKEQEILEISQRYKHAENMLSRMSVQCEDSNATKTGSVMSIASPHKIMPRINSNSPKSSASSGFPTSQSFRAEQMRSPAKRTLVSKNKGTQAPGDGSPHILLPKMGLKVTNPKGHVTGPQLVLKVMNSQLCALDKIPQSKHFEEPCRTSNVTNFPAVTSTDMRSFSSDEACQAVAALTESYVPENTMTLVHTVSSLLQIQKSAGLPQIKQLLQTEGQNTVLLLPVISQSLELYTDSLEKIQDLSSASPSTASMSAPSTMTDSLTPSDVGLSLPSDLTPDNITKIAAVESEVLVMLNVLKCLVQYCPHIRNSLLKEDNTDTDELALHTLKNQPGSSSKDVDSARKRDSLPQNDVMQKLYYLANPAIIQTRPEARNICTIALDIIASIFESATGDSLKKLTSLPLGDVLLGCLPAGDGNTSRFTLVGSMFRVLNCLVRDNDLLIGLCSQSEDCLLENIYQASIQTVGNIPSTERSALQYKLVQVLSTALTSTKKFGGHELCNQARDCPCTEVIKHLVWILHEVAMNPAHTSNDRDMDLLRQGTSILQALSLTDKDFTLHHHEVEPQYVQLVCALEEFYRTSLAGTNPIEKAVAHDLWDFKQDLPSEDEPEEDSQEREDSRSGPEGQAATSSARIDKGGRSRTDNHGQSMDIN